jgi:hypothetical protein
VWFIAVCCGRWKWLLPVKREFTATREYLAGPISDMALSLSYYVKNLFASSYGKDRPAFFIWHPKGTPSSEKKYASKLLRSGIA